MLHVFVCEDDDKYLHMITKCVNNFIRFEGYDIEFALRTKDPAEVIEYIKQHTVNGLYFLDVELEGGYNGVDVARQIREHDPRGFIVFITAHESYMQLTFEYKVEPLDYIRKTDIDDVQKKVCECIKNAYSKHVTRQNEGCFIFKARGDKKISCFHSQILFIETDPLESKRLILHSEKRQYTFYGTLKDVANELPEGMFFGCHKSFIVNISKIPDSGIVGLKSGKDYVIMPNGNKCQVAARKRRQLINLALKRQAA